MAEVDSVTRVEVSQPPLNWPALLKTYRKVLLVYVVASYTSLWLVKIGFLIFFKQLGTHQLRSLTTLWRTVLVITILSYFACFAAIPYTCMSGDLAVTVAAGCETSGNGSTVAIAVGCALDILTDFLSTWKHPMEKMNEGSLTG